MKCIRNNWINQADKTFVFPDFHHNSSLKHASFFDLITLYHTEREHTLKNGYMLTWKSLFPNAIERQNVKLALRIIDRTTVAALEILGPNSSKMHAWEGTSAFVTIVLKFWNIVIVKNTTKGIQKRLEDAQVISDTNDRRLQWLQDFACWL